VLGTLKKKPLEQLLGLICIDARSVAGEDGKQISLWSRE
jgi:hypothetical protein